MKTKAKGKIKVADLNARNKADQKLENVKGGAYTSVVSATTPKRPTASDCSPYLAACSG